MAKPNEADLTDRQRDVLKRLRAGEEPPSIAKALKMSNNGVYQHRRRLEEKGFLKRKDRVAASAGSANGRSRSTAPRSRRRRASSNGHRPAEVEALVKALGERDTAIKGALGRNEKEQSKLARESEDLEQRVIAAKAEEKALKSAHTTVAKARKEVTA